MFNVNEDDNHDDSENNIEGSNDDFYLGKGLVGRGAWTRDPGK